MTPPIQNFCPRRIHSASDSRDPDQRDCIVSNAKLAATGFRAEHSLDDGIRELIKGFTMIRNTRYGNV